MRESLLYEHAGNDDGTVICNLCAHRCRIASGEYGICGVRENSGKMLHTHVYGRAIAERADPIEKKPLYHFLPSSATYSIAALGCNFKCDFCQNWSISQMRGLRSADMDTQGAATPPKTIIECALKQKCQSVSFTYTEPTVFFEYALDTAKLAKDAKLKTIFVSNGYMTPECLKMVAPYLSACNIDLKSFCDDFYREHCGASLKPVLESLKMIREMGVWLEVTTLVITDVNDSDKELGDIAGFIADELGADVPWHVSKFYPQYRMGNHPATAIASIERAVQAGVRAGLKYVYAGNVDFAQNTLCPSCRSAVIRRCGYTAEVCGLDVEAGTCQKCGAKISGIFY
ncbi:MAG: AmmeMemoRadiSam system radical SAM enzyme [Chitinispirillales bacterium]|jgi:pyruvate formate lyase activating enzyme|nr:AmmeMemoRadiSam system radical SAM enzyme [Chitinispirillales bacterium]